MKKGNSNLTKKKKRKFSIAIMQGQKKTRKTIETMMRMKQMRMKVRMM